MQSEPRKNRDTEADDDSDLKQLFRTSAPEFGIVDIDAVLNEATHDSATLTRDTPSQSITPPQPTRLTSTLSSISQSRRRILMFSKLGALGVCAASICVALVFTLWGGNTVLGQVQDALKKTKTATYTVNIVASDEPAQTWHVKLQGENLCRVDQPGGIYLILDISGKRIMEVNPAESKVRITENLPVPQDFNILAKLMNLSSSAAALQPGVPSREFDGITGIGFVVDDNGVQYNVWIDPKTNLPLEMAAERKVSRPDGQKGVKEQVVMERWTGFSFDQPLDESLFAFEVPKGFAVETRQAPAGGGAAIDEERQAAEAQKAAQEAALNKAQDDK